MRCKGREFFLIDKIFWDIFLKKVTFLMVLDVFWPFFCKLSMSGTHSGNNGERDNERGAKQEIG